ncbi:hypothetical protein BT93_L4662 [Corymbia citriodora subsp. variegata]|uniref:Methyltransferase n=1 Tax=Corymbia citriodora subsp. variegata TaxID=360336 RepID=A0A8T0CJX8_CORYI|nr:hypothetical protein BT93_L4662 [Corymbia citriodora subsp. variegata]
MSSTTTTTQQSQGIFKSFLDTSARSDSVPVPRGPTTASLTFYAPPKDGASPFNYVEKAPEGEPQKNYEELPHEQNINDIRGRESQFELNTHAFAAIQNISSEEKDFNDDAHIKSVYYPEVEKLLLDHVPGANRILLFDHTIRRSDPNAHRAPVTRCHIDQTAKSAAQRVEYHLPDEAETLLKGRYRIINVWRPLNGPVVASPLAFAASSSVPDHAVVPVEHRYPHRTGETAGIKATEGQEWYYWSGMTNDERLFLQCFDSQGKGARVPHTAFADPRTQPEWPGRDSIEVRALVFG